MIDHTDFDSNEPAPHNNGCFSIIGAAIIFWMIINYVAAYWR